MAWAVSFATLPPADFRFNKGDEVKTIDPAKATGQPEHRILTALFQGLLHSDAGRKIDRGQRQLPPSCNVPVRPNYQPHSRRMWKTYTFMDSPARSLVGRASKMTADDFVWSWRRTLHPETASKATPTNFSMSPMLKKYHSGARSPKWDRVEVELNDRKNPAQTFPSAAPCSRGIW